MRGELTGQFLWDHIRERTRVPERAAKMSEAKSCSRTCSVFLKPFYISRVTAIV